jgi:beta-glucosidase
MKQFHFPKDFFFGTSTAATQIETAFEHDWEGYVTPDQYTFARTTDHELHFQEDAAIIASLAPHYRMSLQWSKLQRGPGQDFHEATLREYLAFLHLLRSKGVTVMMVLHHFTNPRWFAARGGWEKKENVALWIDYAQKVVDLFGPRVSYWNTFNEPNVYASYGWITGFFPPFKSNPVLAATVVKNMSLGHEALYAYIKQRYPQTWVGISHNAVVFSQENLLGWFPARLGDWWFMDYVPAHFEVADFFGISYYGRISHDPFPITYLQTPEKIKKLRRRHDDIWDYHPQGLRTCLDRYWSRYKKPMIITENGICTQDDDQRQQAIREYAQVLHGALREGIDIRGYYWWSTWDNFEWHLGPQMRFGLYACDWETKVRTERPSAKLYRTLAKSKILEIGAHEPVHDT